MKIDAKLLFIIIVFTLTIESFSQTFGIKAGLNLSTVLMKDDEITYSEDFKIKPGFQIGPKTEFAVNNMISVETALLLSANGYKIIETEPSEYKARINLFYLEIPLMAKAIFNAGFSNFYVAAGPYVGFGIGGTTKTDYILNGESYTETEKVEWNSDENDDNFKRLDFGLTMGAGIELNPFEIGLVYGLGLANISSSNVGGYKINNRVLGILIGYNFGGAVNTKR